MSSRERVIRRRIGAKPVFVRFWGTVKHAVHCHSYVERYLCAYADGTDGILFSDFVFNREP